MAAGPAPTPPSLPVIGSANLPRDLSPWSMFMSADILVQTVMVGLAFASLVTWTVWLAKNIELWAAMRTLRRALAAISGERSLADRDLRANAADRAARGGTVMAPTPVTTTTSGREIAVRTPRWVGATALLIGATAIAVGLLRDATRIWSDLLVNGFAHIMQKSSGLTYVNIGS